ncbi:MAG: hypothetical protein WCW35_09050 [Bacteroidota bacterium]
MKKPQLFYIEWTDALTFSEEWLTKEDVCKKYKNEDWLIKQVGYILNETRDYILVASKYNPQENNQDKFAEITKIPTTWIKKKKLITSS